VSRDAGTTRFEARAMGSPLRFTFVGLPRAAAERAWALVRAEFEASEASLSRWRTSSGLSRLNRAAGSGPQAVDWRLASMLVASARAQRLSGGRFDPRVIARLESLGDRAGVPLPTARGPDPVGTPAAWLELDPRRGIARLAVPVDSGGIGKGLALRWAVKGLERAGLLGAGLLLEAGGDLVTRGLGPSGGPWQVGVENPAGSDTPLAVIATADAAIATSSTAIRHWPTADGRTAHHLIDPATGEPGGDGLAAVTVAGSDPAWAEVWSKTLFLSGARRIGHEARRRGLAAWWVEADGSLHLSPSAVPLTAWISNNRAA
jgi:thiamine biosynthesis lipoprotein